MRAMAIAAKACAVVRLPHSMPPTRLLRQALAPRAFSPLRVTPGLTGLAEPRVRSWGLLLRSWSNALSDSDAIAKDAAVKGARLALDGVTRLGRARVGDKTLVDALVPFVETLEREAASGKSLPDAWSLSADAAKSAADATSALTPKLGRARAARRRASVIPMPGRYLSGARRAGERRTTS